MITQIEVSLNPRRFTRNGRRPLLVFSLLLCLQCAPSANAQTMSDQLQFVMAGRKALLAGSDDRLKLVEPPRPEIQNTREITTLELGTPIERELAGGQEHDYQITLAEGQYAFVVVEQRGIDVVVQLLGPDGKSITESDFETRNQGTEKIEVVAEAAGRYRLLVKAKYPKLPTGRYEIRFSEVRNATEKDRSLEEARRYQAESWRVSDSGKYTEALALAEKALELEERAKGSEHPDLAAFLISIAIIDYYKADYAKAEALYLRALRITEKALGPEHPLVARILSNLAYNHSRQGDDAHAEPLHQRALAIRERVLGPDHPDVAQSLSGLAYLYRDEGDLVRPELLLQRALMISEKALGEESEDVARSLNYLAGVYREKGDYAQAEPLYQRSLTIWEKLWGTNHPTSAPWLLNLGNLYRDMRDYEKAESFYLRALSIKEKTVGPDHPDVAGARASLALLYYDRGDYAKAEALYLSALPILEKSLGPNHQEVGSYQAKLADLYVAINDYGKAEPLYQRALSTTESYCGTDCYKLVDILEGMARMYAAEGRITEAIAVQARANVILEHALDLNLATGSERQKLTYLATLQEQIQQTISLHVRFATNDLKARELAASTVLQQQGRVQDALSNNLASLRNRFSPADQALLDQLNLITSRLARLVLNGPHGVSLAEHQSQIKTLEEQREELESEVSRRSAGFYHHAQPVTLPAIRSTLPDNAALIELAVYRPSDPKAHGAKAYGEPRYITYVVRKKGDVQWKELGEAKEIDSRVEAWRQALRDPQRKDVQQLARALDEKIMQPVRALTGDATHLLVFPDGALNLIPFAALVDEQGRYLIERYSFTYLTSGRDLLRMQVARESGSKPLVIANPSFGEPSTELLAKGNATSKLTARNGRRRSITTGKDLSEVYFAPLGGTAQEARTIQALFPDANLLTGAQATESAIKQTAAPRILHIATHGFFLQDTPAGPPNAQVAMARSDPRTQATVGSADTQVPTRAISATTRIENPLLRSGLALAGANLHNNNSDDGILTALEASGLNLWGTKLVVLSACDTGLGEVRNGEGVYGLRRAFVLAGAESLVMSLWPASDYTTRELMSSYYKNLKQGMGRGAALRQVQLDMLKHNPKLHPFYWANFIQSGEWANLSGQR